MADLTPPTPAVLIAEDGLSYRRLIVELLTPFDVECITVVDGRQAIRVLRDISREVALLITDLEMPHATGWDVIRAAREHRGHELPIIMQTGQAQVGYVWSRARELDIVLIDKLDVPARLVPAVSDLLDGRP
jgi:CheY-like chemotaxis protein